MSYSNNLDTLVDDIYKTVDQLSNSKNLNIPLEVIDEFGESMKKALTHWATPRQQSRGLRMSNVGRPARQLWYDINLENNKVDNVSPSTQI